jgi:NADH-quinone oxidoreductase subunit H
VLKTLLTFAMFAAKTGFFIFLFMWVRWTLPRFRYDQLMSLGWSIMLPVALAYILIVATVSLGLDWLGISRGLMFSLALFALNVALLVFLFWWLDRGRLISPPARAWDRRPRATPCSRSRPITSAVDCRSSPAPGEFLAVRCCGA